MGDQQPESPKKSQLKVKVWMVLAGLQFVGVAAAANHPAPGPTSSPSKTTSGSTVKEQLSTSTTQATKAAAASTPTATPASAPVAQTSAPAVSTSNQSNLSNYNTYTNSDGNTVHSPATTTDGSVPAGATCPVQGWYL